jgi:protein dithiol oxidoreductase (disulfide-forming)
MEFLMRRKFIAGLCVLALCAAQGIAKPKLAPLPAPPAAPPPPAYTEGVQYERVTSPQPPMQAGHLEVTEFFSYGCIHCFHFEPYVEAWRKTRAADVDLVLVPATFRSDFALFARGYYASEALGVSEKVHAKIWQALWTQQVTVRDIEQMADLYASVGVDKSQFIDACATFAIEAKLKRAGDLLAAYQVAGTPDLIVAGKYRVLLGKLTNASDAFAVVNYLLGLERDERKRAAASSARR